MGERLDEAAELADFIALKQPTLADMRGPFRIDHDIPPPDRRSSVPKGRVKATLVALKVGDSFILPPPYSIHSTLDQAKLMGLKLKVRNTPAGIRFWRAASVSKRGNGHE